ncbi:VanZ family protein [Bacillus salacetis]|nr:VanZ family protein [Bacillus salacetis]
MIHLVEFTFFIYVLLLISLTLLPIPIDKRLIQSMIETKTYAKNLFIPFQDILRTLPYAPISVTLKQLLGNILLFVPFGFYIPIITRYKNFKSVLLYTLAVSLSVEVLQQIISLLIGVRYRSFVVDDIMLNLIGGIIGYSIIKISWPLIRNLLIDRNNPAYNLWRV